MRRRRQRRRMRTWKWTACWTRMTRTRRQGVPRLQKKARQAVSSDEEEDLELPELDQAGAEAGADPSSMTTLTSTLLAPGWSSCTRLSDMWLRWRGTRCSTTWRGVASISSAGPRRRMFWRPGTVTPSSRSIRPFLCPSRHMELPKNLVDKVYHHFRVQWLFICWNLYFSPFSFQKNSS
jgi:hypothetical protein